MNFRSLIIRREFGRTNFKYLVMHWHYLHQSHKPRLNWFTAVTNYILACTTYSIFSQISFEYLRSNFFDCCVTFIDFSIEFLLLPRIRDVSSNVDPCHRQLEQCRLSIKSLIPLSTLPQI